MEAVGKLLEYLGFAAPLLYGAAVYGFFGWLDENLSDAAKAALASEHHEAPRPPAPAGGARPGVGARPRRVTWSP
jgi:hypothetical protein